VETGPDLDCPRSSDGVTVAYQEDVFVIVLPRGPSTNCAQNVLAAGQCVLTWKGVDHRSPGPS
jgi:hypothetical protein